MKGKRYGGLFSVLSSVILAAGLMISSGIATVEAAGPGPEVCANCHADQVKSYQATKHSTKTDARTPANAGACATCHGDGTAHVKAGGGKGVGGIINPASKTLSADAKNATCVACHSKDAKRSHWEGSTHQTRDTTCVACHNLHGPDKVRNKVTQPEVCFTCHKQQRSEINRLSRHPIQEGKVACSDCHNPHGSAGPKLMKRDNVVDTCYQCHAEKRGPFVHPHEPVVENCANCHNPHGSTTENMLKMRMPFLCHQCHTPHGGTALVPPGTPGGPTSGKNYSYSAGRGCVTCHTQIHGGNNPSFTNPTVQFMFR